MVDVSLKKVDNGKRLVNRVKESVRVSGVLGDGAYDSRANFNFLEWRHIKPVIRIRKGSVLRSRGSQARKLAVIEQQAFKPKAWSRIHRVGYRWRVEGAFSVIKRVFGEYVTAKKFVNMAKEMAMKASVYNTFITAMVQGSDDASARPMLEGRVMQQSIDERSLKSRFGRVQYWLWEQKWRRSMTSKTSIGLATLL